MNSNIGNTPLTDHNYEEVLERSFKTVPNNAITPTNKPDVKLDSKFLETSQSFWLLHEGGKYYPIYNEGMLNGTYNARQPNFRSITETLVEALKNIIRMQCEKEDKTPQEFATYMEILEKTFSLICDKLDQSLEERIDGEMIAGYLHATINSFINTNIKKKE